MKKETQIKLNKLVENIVKNVLKEQEESIINFEEYVPIINKIKNDNIRMLKGTHAVSLINDKNKDVITFVFVGDENNKISNENAFLLKLWNNNDMKKKASLKKDNFLLNLKNFYKKQDNKTKQYIDNIIKL